MATGLGFIEKGEGGTVIKSPLADYIFPGVGNEAAATALAGLTGTLVTFGAMYGLARLLKKKEAGCKRLNRLQAVELYDVLTC